MRRPRILLGLTGSVGSAVADKIFFSLSNVGEVKIVTTKWAEEFYDFDFLSELSSVTWFKDEHEWMFRKDNTVDDWDHPTISFPGLDGDCKVSDFWTKGDPVLHIELRKWADVMVIAPLSANTLAKAANGMCDNLLTSVIRAWEPHKPMVIAPAMDTVMWESPFTEEHIGSLRSIFPLTTVGPVSKGLVYGDEGMGALAHADDIAASTKEALRWQFPIDYHWTRGVPTGHHPGAFGFQRKHDVHDGVDIYVPEFLERGDAQVRVKAVEPGTVIAVEHFTGPQIGMPWWEYTDVVLVEGKSGIVGYGEIRPRVEVGRKLRRGDEVGWVTEVLKHRKRREDIPGHSRRMLHLALYEPGHRDWKAWTVGADVDDHVDPTPLLQDSIGWPGRLPEFEGEL